MPHMLLIVEPWDHAPSAGLEWAAGRHARMVAFGENWRRRAS